MLRMFILLIWATSFMVLADGSSTGGKVVHIASVDGAILFRVSGNTESNRPTCASSHRFSVPESSSHATVVLTAFVTGKALAHVSGKGQCTLWPNSEDIRWIEVCPMQGC